jgi:hypothetical protein
VASATRERRELLRAVDHLSGSAKTRDDPKPDQECNPRHYKGHNQGRDNRNSNDSLARAFRRRKRRDLLLSVIDVFSCAKFGGRLGSIAHVLIHKAMCGPALVEPTRGDRIGTR